MMLDRDADRRRVRVFDAFAAHTRGGVERPGGP